ncbi:polysaccharide biosynthesis C-terminal domain-containing protein [Acutalibacter sp. 1XD8-33]|uniref:polysaccharide biosynthesis C-terminal domain-containing protein n=1 Tax=Acutalibacter sp. 1XD8-33 TaxID=2320081 RepID=UPI00131488BA|nr:polysaccharide biosynthesis C-terminal domain-containing protein [Acutalibacter sp. 1XD8-33]
MYLGCGIFTIAQLVLERMPIATGKTLYSMISQATGAILNLILDPILIFGYFGAPKLGISGAALATVIGQFAAACIALALNLTKNKKVRLRFTLRPPLYAVRQVLHLGLPTTVLFALNSFMMISYNAVLNRFSSTAVAVFGACSRVTGFFYAVVGALCVGFPEMFLRMFNATEDMIAIGVWRMRMLSCCYLLCGVRNMSTAIIQSLGHSVPSMAVDLSRNYAVLIPFAWLLSMTGSIDAVWVSVPTADVVSAVVGVLLMVRFYRKEIRGLVETQPV